MKKATLIVGNITFEGLIGEEGTKAIVHEIHGIIDFEHAHTQDAIDTANRTGEDLVNLFDGYIVLQSYKGEIVYECEKGIQLEKEKTLERELMKQRVERASQLLSNEYDKIEAIIVQLDAIPFETGLEMRLENSCEDIIVWGKVEGEFTVNEFLEEIAR